MADSHAHEGHDHVWADDLTRNQELVLGTLAHATAPLSAYDILDQLRDEGLRAPLQVYRALDKLTERGLAHRLESLNAFVCCADAHCHGRAVSRLRSASDADGSRNSPSRRSSSKLKGWSKCVGVRAVADDDRASRALQGLRG